jgi:predicted metal-dependent hydrolase
LKKREILLAIVDVVGIPSSPNASSRLKSTRMSTRTTTMMISGMSIGIVRVRAVARVQMANEAVRLAVIPRISWVRKQQLRFTEQRRQSERGILSGESHYLEGAGVAFE